MANVAVAPILLTDVLFQVETDEYQAHVSQVEFVPQFSTVPWKGLTPAAVFQFATRSTWQCNLTFAQDWATTNSLARYLFTNEGNEIDVTFEPVAGGPGFTATLIVSPGSIGGSVDSVAVATVTLAVKGKPVYVPAA